MLRRQLHRLASGEGIQPHLRSPLELDQRIGDKAATQAWLDSLLADLPEPQVTPLRAALDSARKALASAAGGGYSND